MKNSDGIDWVPYTSGSLHVANGIVYARILPATPTCSRQLFSNTDVTVMGHYSSAKDKLIGYSVVPRKGCVIQEATPTALGLLFDTSDGPHEPADVVFGAAKLKLYRFAKGERHNYALSLRGK